MLLSRPRRILMTVDAVGGVWRYSLDLARALRPLGVETVLLGFGPPPDAGQRREAEEVGELRWTGHALDWMASGRAALRGIPETIARVADRAGAELIHVNLPSQAAGLDTDRPVLVVSHSCVVSWFRVVLQKDVSGKWLWHRKITAAGFDRADAIVAPTAAHADLLVRCYPGLRPVSVVHNSARGGPPVAEKRPYVYAAGRWWDEGKNAETLDAAAALTDWPVLVLGSNVRPDGRVTPMPNVCRMGSTGHADLRDIAASAAIFVSSSAYEAFGLAALEAALSGAALVLSDIPVYRELWDGAAVFANPYDPAAFAAALNRLAADPPLRMSHAARAMRRAAELTPERQAREMLAEYARLTAADRLAAAE